MNGKLSLMTLTGINMYLNRKFLGKIEVNLKPYIGEKNTPQLRKELADALCKTLAEVIEEELEKNNAWNNLKFELLCGDYTKI